ncbi:M28 family metallopeptidase [Photorhabdus sp. APURE]|uniref:M28 family metallopeptidase n=1 Tax=Photorhabdus aballayi TaxID=2991723 RepID=UPI00223E4B28|nr:M28 family metallopeptidase [Photorhabdus aballayi]MCW7548728.1 M28 family metallopeptidase [Photorhabdus aballayi]
MKRIFLIICFLATLIVAIIQGIGLVLPDKVSVEYFKESGFKNVMRTLGVIAAEPHPAASTRQALVRDYLINEMNDMGYSVTEQTFHYTADDLASRQKKIYPGLNSQQRRTFDKQFVRMNTGNFAKQVEDQSELTGTNLIAKLEVPSPKGTLLFVSHYDSVRTAPGASDNGMVVASVLQLMRDLAERTDIKNNVIFLFSDAEELGLLGAYHFVKNINEIATQPIDIVFNFDARGNNGVPFLFETSVKNLALVSEWNRNADKPVAFSFSPIVYQMLQNNTDFSVFLDKGFTGMNFATILGYEHYHRMSDTVENLNLGTLWRYQRTIRDLGVNFAVKDQINLSKESVDAVYFPVPYIGLIITSVFTAFVAGILTFLLSISLAIKNIVFSSSPGTVSNIQSIFRILAGLFSLVTALIVPTASYLVTLPVLLFLLTDLMLREFNKFSVALILLVIYTYITSILYVPVIYLVFVGLHAPVVGGVLAILPMLILGFGIANFWKRVT